MTDAEWQRAVIERANGKCEICEWIGRIGIDATSSHHIIKRRYNISRHDIRNGIALCLKHHTIAHNSRFAYFFEDDCINLSILRGDFKDREEYDKWRQHVKTARVGLADRIKK